MRVDAKRPRTQRIGSRRPEVTGLEDRTLLSTVAPANIDAGATAYVTRLYADLLNRAPDDFGLANFVPTAEAGPEGRLQVVETFLGSAEYRAVQIQGMYADLLGRAPDDFGAEAFNTFLQQPDAGILQARSLVYGSDEYFQARGGGTDEGFLRALWSDALRRGIGDGALDEFLGELQAGTSRTDVAEQVLGGEVASEVLINDLYADLLFRAPDADGFDGFLGALQDGLTEEDFIGTIVLAPEYVDTASELTDNLVTLAAGAEDLSTLVTAVQAAGLLEALEGSGPFTIFAPTNDAFAALPEGTLDALLADPELLSQILLYHVVPGSFSSPRVLDAGTLTSAEGSEIGVRTTASGTSINDAGLIVTDLRATNGVVHLIDTVLLPPTDDLVQTAIDAGPYETLVTAVQAAGLVETLQGDGPFTILAPTDEAFAALPEGTLDALLADPDQLADVLLYHVLPGSFSSADLIALGLLPTAQGSAIDVTRGDDGVLINGETAVIGTNVVATNGLIHAIDAVLLPPTA